MSESARGLSIDGAAARSEDRTGHGNEPPVSTPKLLSSAAGRATFSVSEPKHD